jgi:hypothetical protein
MTEVRLEFPSGNGQTDPADIDDLRADLDQHVGATSYAQGSRIEGAKSGFAVDTMTLVVSLLGTPAVVSLIGVIKSYFERERVNELTVTTDRGSVTIKGGVDSDDMKRALESVLGPA